MADPRRKAGATSAPTAGAGPRRAPLAGRTVLVTGAAQRIGKAIALHLGGLGADVAVHYNGSAAAARAVCRDLEKLGVRAAPLQADLADAKAGQGLVAAARRDLGAVDFLVNNASTFPAVRLDALTWEELARSIQVDAWAPLELTRALRGQLPKRGGAVVNLLDARIADFDLAHAGYYLAKRMLADLTRMAAVEFAPQLRVNGVAPGPILPPPGGDPSDLTRWGKHLPLRKTPTPEDVAQAVAYLLGASGVTGEILHVDGGRHLGRAVYG